MRQAFAWSLVGLVFVASLLALAIRRLANSEVRYLSASCEYFDLGLLLAIAATGLALRWLSTGTDLAAVRGYLAALLSLRPVLPPSGIFLAHFTLVNLLLIYFPFSKLVHLTAAIILRSLLVAPAPSYPTFDKARGRVAS
jgi:nitrate reductase gamma subunit